MYKRQSQCSFGFDIVDQSTEVMENGTTVWKLRKVKPVSYTHLDVYKRQMNDTGGQIKALSNAS